MRITVTRSVIQAEAARKRERRVEQRRPEHARLLQRPSRRAGRERGAEPQAEQPIRELTKL